MRHSLISDFMSNLDNAARKGKREIVFRPYSKLIGNILGLLKERGYVEEYEIFEDGRGGGFRIRLSPHINRCGPIMPHFPVKYRELEKWEKRYLPALNFGFLIMTTNRGIMASDQAKRERVGGRLLAYIY